MSHGNIAPFFTNWGPASATQGGFLTASAQSFPPFTKTFTGQVNLNNANGTTGALTACAFANKTGNALLYGVNSSIHTIASTSGGGAATLGFNCYHGATANTMARSGASSNPMAIQASSTALSFLWAATSTANSDISFSTAVTLDGTNGLFTFLGGTKTGSSGTTITQTKVYSQTLTPASVAANTTAEQTFTVTGLTTADKVTLNPGAAPTAGTGIVGVRVSAADTLAVTYSNNTAGALTPVSSTCLILATRS